MNLYSPEDVRNMFPENRRPYTVKALAERWGCSDEHIRKMVKSGQLQAFALGGKLIRISAEEVDRWEKGRNSFGTGESLPSASSRADIDSAVRLARLTSPSQGHGLPTLSGSGRYNK